ncbi:MAG: RNHCP domain-containing protein [Oligoflexales bacterium]
MGIESPRFTKINESFVCIECGREVPAASSTCRDHCPYCLHSLHVDHSPGDRQNPCRGVLVPQGYELQSKKGIMLIYRCRTCGGTVRNKAVLDDKNAPDDYDKILGMTPKA